MRIIRIWPACLGILLLWLGPAAARASAGPANDGLPKRWAGTTDVSVKGKPPLKTHSVVTFTLAQVDRRLSPAFTRYSYRPTGYIDHEESSAVSEGCTLKTAHRRVAIPSRQGSLEFYVTRLANGHRKVTYQGYGDTSGVRIPLTIACPNGPVVTTFDDAGAWLGTGAPRTISTATKILKGTHAYTDGSGVWKHCFARNPKDVESCKAEGLEAIASTTGAVRGARVTLDGSQSKQNIKSYTWELAPGPDCPAGAALKKTTLTGARISFRLLCSLEATLTVSDGNDEDPTTIIVPVRPRAWKTPFTRRTDDGGPGAPTDPPRATCDASGTCALSIDGGINLTDCPGRPVVGSGIICPLTGGRTWLGVGYTLTTLDDPNGPFDGFAYVASATLTVKRLELINVNLLPQGAKERDGNNFYGFNKARGAPIDGLITAARQHEGLGAPGRPKTGHSGIIQADLNSPSGDPEREIEKLIAPAESKLQQQADDKLKKIDMKLDTDSKDPLPNIWRGTLWFWDDAGSRWLAGPAHVP